MVEIGKGLPSGIHVTSRGVIKGRPRKPGTYRFTIKVVDTAGVGATRLFSITVK